MFEARTQLALKNAALQKAYDELERFVYSASHDLRAPLASIMGVVKLARVEGKESKYLELIDTSAKKLDSFVKNIISYYQNSKQELVLSSIQIESLIDEILESYTHMEGASSIAITKNVEQNVIFQSDMLRLKIVFNNLISNAIKYSDAKKDEQRIDIKASVSNTELKLSISDNGLGIDEDGLPKIFEMFYRHDNKGMGTGIGLYLVQETLAKLRGTIEVESTVGEGTTFHISVANQSQDD